MNRIEFGMFFFNSSHSGISGNYALHAKQAIRERVAEREPRVRNSGWHVLSGDLFGFSNLQIILGTATVSPDATRLDPVLHRAVTGGPELEFVPYVVGMFMCPLDILRHADRRLKADRVVGYLGLATLVLPNENALREISEGLSLPMTSLHSI
jgi:hypothetical protein